MPKKIGAVILAAAVMIAFGAKFASAEDATVSMDTTITTTSSYNPTALVANITDPSNMLGENKPAVQQVIDEVMQQSGENLFIVMLPRFDGATTPDEWADLTASISGFTANCVLFGVSYENPQVVVFIPKDSENLSESKIAQIVDVATPHLEKAAWVDAIKAVGTTIIAQTTLPSNSVLIVSVVIGIALIAVAGYLLWFFVWRPQAKTKRAARRHQAESPVEEHAITAEQPTLDPNVTSTDIAAVKIDKFFQKRSDRKQQPDDSIKKSGGRRRAE